MIGGIEAGGTKFVCAIADEDLKIVEKISIPTTHPDETMANVFSFFDDYQITAIGVGAFGPIDIDQESDFYGYIRETPKKDWKDYNLIGTIKNRYQVPVSFTTDVNAAALGEYHFGSARSKQSCLYLTVGTGVGGGAVLSDNLLVGNIHPEMGHIIINKKHTDLFEVICPYHAD